MRTISIIDTLVTDRIKADDDRLLELRSKGVDGWTEQEADEWLNGGYERLYYSDGEMMICTDGILYSLDGAGIKGAYNSTDLNRVGAAAIWLAELLTADGYDVSVDLRTDWTMLDLIYADDLQHYLSELQKIRNTLTLATDTPDMPNAITNVDEANLIERLLVYIDRLRRNMEANYRYCAAGAAVELYAGEDDYQ